jgi:endonuclease I
MKMKKILTYLLLSITLFGFAQIPAGYYNTATGTGLTLKTQLKTRITTGHVDQGYGSLWGLYTNTAFRDTNYENDNSLIDMYSENPTGTDPYNYTSTAQQCGSYAVEGECYNREHIVPQAFFDGVAIDPMKNDPFHVAPTDGKVNGLRDNYPYGRVNSPTSTTLNGSKLGPNVNSGYSAGYTSTVFEPLDEFKGDIARSIFYFVTRYEDNMVNFYNTTAVVSKNMFDGTANNALSPTFLNIMITWHLQDPVSAKEIARNNAIYAYQGNRNPYIDHPEYVCQIWSAACAALSTSNFNAISEITVYPNPSNNGTINISSETVLDQIELITINGQIIQQISKPEFQNNNYTITNLPSGFYFLKLSGGNDSVTKKVLIN